MRRITFILLFLVAALSAHSQSGVNPCPNALPVPQELKLPASLPPGEPVQVEKQMLAYVSTLHYRDLGWCHDKWVRDTGPLMDNVDAIVHPPVHIYYSPEVSEWLRNGRKGEIPDGAVIIKEQFAPSPAERYRSIPLDKLGCSNDWTIMVRNSEASRDGWFWAELWTSTDPQRGMKFNNAFQYPNAGYGIYCLRCHASAEHELTFSSLSNIEGAPGWPLQFRVDDSWRDQKAPLPPHACAVSKSTIDFEIESAESLTAKTTGGEQLVPPEHFPQHEQNAAIQENLKAMTFLHARTLPDIQTFPPEPLDDRLAPSEAAIKAHPNWPHLLTSSQCLGCHSGLTGNSVGPTMVRTVTDAVTKKPLTLNFSPYGEWRWSPMGLAGRDPVFFSQLDSELVPLPDHQQKQLVIDTCMTCHGAMGKRAFSAEHPGEDFKIDFVYDRDPHSQGFRYGGLARDGISCEVCHRMAAPKDPGIDYFFKHQINGIYDITPADELHGPFKDAEITQYQMNAGLGVKPKYNPYLQSSQMCGSCHTIVLPVLDSPEKGKTSVEQATYPEWLNSAYRNEYGSMGATPKTCQECHMPAGYASAQHGASVPVIQDKIAIVQDLTYPQTEYLTKPADLDVRYRETGFKRHELLGANGFLLQMFAKPLNELGNNETLGVRTADYMTGLTTDLVEAAANVVQQARSITATVAINKYEIHGNTLIVEATVTNLAGHRYPSGVGFRRAFLGVTATVNGKTVFTSGATNDRGEIVDLSGKVLPTESFADGTFQPHFCQSKPIRSSDQVQIYEELTKDAGGNFTTSFTRRDEDVKDNRLLPLGWSEHGPADMKIPEQFLHATQPVGDAAKDPVYLAGKGQSIVRYEIPLPSGATEGNTHVRVQLFSQTMPPYYFADRSRTRTPATKRLEYLAGTLGTLSGTDYENWKLLIASAKR
jgi:hypothetical protein